MTIEKAKPSDVVALASLEEQLFAHEAYGIASLKQELENPNRLYLVAKNQEEVIGYVGVNLLPDMAEILKIAVLEKFRQQGVGAQLLNSAINELRKRQLNQLQLEVNEHNLPAIAFYKKNGFGLVYTRKHYYANGANALILSREI